MGYAILASESTVRLAGETPADIDVQSIVEGQVTDQLGSVHLTSETHIGYAKVTPNGVNVELFPQYTAD